MSSISAREANQSFSKLLKRAEEGEEVVITRRGKPVARLVPIRKDQTDKDRERAIVELMELLNSGLHLGGHKFTRDELHER